MLQQPADQWPGDVSRASLAGARALFVDVDALLGCRRLEDRTHNPCPLLGAGNGAGVAAAGGGVMPAAVCGCSPAGPCEVTPMNLQTDQSLKRGRSLCRDAGVEVRWGRSLVDEDTDDNETTGVRGHQHAVRVDDDDDVDVDGNDGREGRQPPCPLAADGEAAAAPPSRRRQTMSGFDPAVSDTSRSVEIVLAAAAALVPAVPPLPHSPRLAAPCYPGAPAAAPSGPPRGSYSNVVRPGARRFLIAVQRYYTVYAFSSSSVARGCGCGCGEECSGQGRGDEGWLEAAVGLLDPPGRFLIRRLPLLARAAATQELDESGAPVATPTPQPARSEWEAPAALPAPFTDTAATTASSLVDWFSGTAVDSNAVILTSAPRALYGNLSDNVIQVVPYDTALGQHDDVLDLVASILGRHLAADRTAAQPGGRGRGGGGGGVPARRVLQSLGLWPGALQPRQAMQTSHMLAAAWAARSGSPTEPCRGGQQAAAAGGGRGAPRSDFGGGSRGGGRRRAAKGRSRSLPEYRSWLAVIPEDWEGESQQQQQQQEQQVLASSCLATPGAAPAAPGDVRQSISGGVTLRQLVLAPQSLPSQQPHPPQAAPQPAQARPEEGGTGQELGRWAGGRCGASPFTSAEALSTVSVTAMPCGVAGGAPLTRGSRACQGNDSSDGGRPDSSELDEQQQQQGWDSAEWKYTASLKDGENGPRSGGSSSSNSSNSSKSTSNSSCDGGGRKIRSAAAKPPRLLRSFSYPVRAALRLLGHRTLSGPAAVHVVRSDPTFDAGAGTEGTAVTGPASHHPRELRLPVRASASVARAFASATSRARHYWHHLSPHERKAVHCGTATVAAVAAAAATSVTSAIGEPRPSAAVNPAEAAAKSTTELPPQTAAAAAATTATTAVAPQWATGKAALITVPAATGLSSAAGGQQPNSAGGAADGQNGGQLPWPLGLPAACRIPNVGQTPAAKGAASRRDFRLASEAMVLAGELSALLHSTTAAAAAAKASTAAALAFADVGAMPRPCCGAGALQSLFQRAMATARAVSYKPLREIMQEVVWRHADPTRGSQEEVMLWLLWEINEVAKRQGAIIACPR